MTRPQRQHLYLILDELLRQFKNLQALMAFREVHDYIKDRVPGPARFVNLDSLIEMLIARVTDARDQVFQEIYADTHTPSGLPCSCDAEPGTVHKVGCAYWKQAELPRGTA